MEILTDVEKRKYYKRHVKNIGIIFALIAVLLIVSVISVSTGASSVNWKDAIKIFFGLGNVSDSKKQIVLLIRLPRIAAAVMAGIALSCSGLLMQGVFRNPLVSPYTLGVSNGAAFGAAVAIVFLPNVIYRQYTIAFMAFLFSILTMMIVYTISRINRDNTKTLVLSGVAVGYLFSAMVSAMKYISDSRDLPELVFWTMGSLSGISWTAIMIIAIGVVVCTAFMMIYAWDLNAMTFGEETALSLGVNYKKVRTLSFIGSTLLTSVAVAFTGVIGFVGLIAPHITKMIIGTDDYRYSIPISALMGGVLLLVSDTIARNIIAPTELPVGIITSFIGVPFFLYLIGHKRRKA